ncbi:hypothetical protein GCM10010357_44590 [Streptomyces luteireticuli]|uniref:Uncharacterized protein n=1 Tax=Streptomyces luteireticuli TaxID=173858 RepID=A0ABP3IRE0_9ACTN
MFAIGRGQERLGSCLAGSPNAVCAGVGVVQIGLGVVAGERTPTHYDWIVEVVHPVPRGLHLLDPPLAYPRCPLRSARDELPHDGERYPTGEQQG